MPYVRLVYAVYRIQQRHGIWSASWLSCLLHLFVLLLQDVRRCHVGIDLTLGPSQLLLPTE